MHKKLAFALMLLVLMLTSRLEAADPVKLGLLGFTSPRELMKEADTVTGIFSTIFSASQGISLLRRTRTIDDEDIEAASTFGKSEGCKYILIGSLKRDKDILITVRVVDVDTGKIMFTRNAASQPKDHTSLRAESIKLADKVCEILNDGAFFPLVSGVKGKEIYINRGSSSGVRKGDLYRVYLEILDIKDKQGNVSGSSVMDLAIIEVNSVNRDSSTAALIKNGADERILSSNSFSLSLDFCRIEAISRTEARKLVRNNDFSLEALDDRYMDLWFSNKTNLLSLNARVDGVKVPESELPELQENAELGYPNAQYRLGLFYMERDNFPMALK